MVRNSTFEPGRACAIRAARDIPLADYLQTFRVFHRVVMDAILRESGRRSGAEPALEAARRLLEYADLATTYASDAYLEAPQSLDCWQA